MYKKEFDPLLKEGFLEIQIWELDAIFLEPFGENEQRKYLIDRLKDYINQFQQLNLEADLWIDGSFGTQKPDPEDIDVLFIIDGEKALELDSKRIELFKKLLQDREFIKARYSIDVYYIDSNDEDGKKEWKETYGKAYTNLSEKGIFILKRVHNVQY